MGKIIDYYRKKGKAHKYPDPDEIRINEADLMLKLRDFRRALKNRPSWSDFLVLVATWTILFTSNFRGFWGFTGEEVEGIYLTIVGIVTVVVIYRFFKSVREISCIRRVIDFLFKDDHKPEKLIEAIKERCKDGITKGSPSNLKPVQAVESKNKKRKEMSVCFFIIMFIGFAIANIWRSNNVMVIIGILLMAISLIWAVIIRIKIWQCHRINNSKK